mgnify:CR=1 FL=1
MARPGAGRGGGRADRGSVGSLGADRCCHRAKGQPVGLAGLSGAPQPVGLSDPSAGADRGGVGLDVLGLGQLRRSASSGGKGKALPFPARRDHGST